MPAPASAPPTDAAPSTSSRPASLWPASGLADLPAPGDAARSTQRERVATRLDLCRSTLAFRVIMLVQGAVGVAGMLQHDSAARWLYHAPVAAVAALAGTLL